MAKTMSEVMAENTAKLHEGALRRRQFKRELGHLASCVEIGGRWFCAADCKHHVTVAVDAEKETR